MNQQEETYGFFEDIDNEDNIIVSYSNANLPNYKKKILPPYNIKRKKKDSYDGSEQVYLPDNYSDYIRRTRIRFIHFIQCCYPIIIMGTILSLCGWFLCTY